MIHEYSPTYEQSTTPEVVDDEQLLLHELVTFYLLDRAVGVTDQQQAYDSGESSKTAEDLVEARFTSWDEYTDLVRDSRRARHLVAPLEQILQEKRALIEPIAEHERTDRSTALTACVPLAVCHESLDTVRTLLTQVEKAQRELDQPVEVLFWANANFTTETEVDTRSTAGTSYAELRAMIEEEFSDDNLRISTALEVLPKSEFSMSQIRQNYMDALIAKAEAEHTPVHHAIMWLDADTTFLSKNCFTEAVEWADQPAIGFFHPDIDYSANWASDTPYGQLDTASKAFIVDEVQRRQARKDVYETNATTPFEYVDEPGLSFSLMTYLASGGVNPSYPIDETEMLFRKLRINRNLPIMDALSEDYEETFDEGVDTTLPINEWNPDARIIVSGRRVYEQTKKHGVAGLATARTNSIGQSEYELFTDIRKDAADEGTLTPEEVATYVEKQNHALSPRRADTVRKIVKRIL